MTNSTTPNTPANGGQILTDERIADLYREAFNGMADRLRDAPQQVPPTVIAFGRAIEADLRTPLAAVPASEPIGYIHTEAQEHMAPYRDEGMQNSMRLYVKMDESRGITVPVYAAPAPVSGMPDLASLQRWEFETYDQGGNWIEPNITGEYVRFADVERLLNPTGATK